MQKSESLLKNKLLLLFAALLTSVIGAEFFFRATYPMFATYNTEMARYARDMKMIVNDRVFRHRANMQGRYYGVEIKTNSQGWREDKEYHRRKQPGVKRILVIGDSITMGWGVKNRNTYPRLLERRLASDPTLKHKYEVINTGIGNYNTFLEYQMLKRSSGYNPDMIILGWFLNDLEIWHKKNGVTSFLGKNSYLYGFLWDRLFSMTNLLGLNQDYLTYYKNLYAPGSQGRLLFEKSLNGIVRFTRRHSIPLVFLNIPDLHSFDPYPFSLANKYIEKLTAKKGIYYLNLLETVENENSKKLWVSTEDPHPNGSANKLFCDSLYDFLIKNGLLE